MGFVGCLKWFLNVINIAFILLGAALLGLGLFIKFGDADALLHMIHGAHEAVTMSESPIGSGETAIDISLLMDTLAVPLLVAGAVTLAGGLLGSAGACSTSRPVLIFNILTLIILFVVELVLVILLQTGQLDDLLRQVMGSTLRNDYSGIDGELLTSVAWNYMMIEMRCCGLSSYADFSEAVHWDPHRVVTQFGVTTVVDLVTPVACCKFTGSYPVVTPVDDTCAVQPTDGISYWKMGCLDKILGIIHDNQPLIIYSSIASFAIKLVLVIANIIVAKSATTGKKAEEKP